MKTYEWAKLWIDMLGDRKVASLPDSSWRRFVECVLLAKELDEGGVLPPVSDMAWRLRISDDTMAADLARLAQNELVELTDHNGEERWWLPNFEKRQEKAIPDAERMRAYRRRKRQAELDSDNAVTVSEHERYDTVTTRNAEQSKSKNKSKSKSREEAEQIGADAPVAAAAWLKDLLQESEYIGWNGRTQRFLTYPWATADYIQAHIEYGLARGDSAGLVVTRIEAGDPIPGSRQKVGGIPDEYAEVIRR